MFRHPVQSFATLLLAATYLVIGATGDSLYYCIESPATERAPGEHRHGGYYHDHGEGLWHYHGPASGESAAAPEREQVREGSAEPIALPASPDRHDHTCLLLAVASAIELSVSLGRTAPSCSEGSCLICSAGAERVDRFCFSRLGARGPPIRG